MRRTYTITGVFLISIVNQKFRAGNATEHTYRGVLEQLMQSLLPKLYNIRVPLLLTSHG